MNRVLVHSHRQQGQRKLTLLQCDSKGPDLQNKVQMSALMDESKFLYQDFSSVRMSLSM